MLKGYRSAAVVSTAILKSPIARLALAYRPK
jgi:hypothetical protein